MVFLESSIFKNEEVLSPEYLPELLPHRENEIKQLANNLLPASKGRKPQNTFLYGAPGIGKCLSPDTEIFLSNGKIVKIEKLYENSLKKHKPLKISKNEEIIKNPDIKVLSLNKKLKIKAKKVAYLYKQRCSEDMVKIQTQSGREIVVTKRHPILTFKNMPKFIQASRLKSGAFIAIPRILHTESSNHKFVSFPHRTTVNEKRINIPVIDENFVRFLALIIGEDSFQKRCIRFFNSNSQLIKEFEQITCNQFGIIPKTSIGKGNMLVTKVFSTMLIKFLKHLEPHLVLKSPQRKIPQVVLQADDKIICSFLRSMFDAEGSIYKIGKNGVAIEFSTSSKELVNQISYLLLREGIVGRIKRGYNGSYRILILGKIFIKKFFQKIGFSDNGKMEKIKEYLEKIKYNPNTDIVPNLDLLVSEVCRISKTKIKYTTIENFVKNIRQGKGVSHERLEKFIKYIEDHLSKLELLYRTLSPKSEFEVILRAKKIGKITWKDLANILGIEEMLFRYHVRTKSKRFLCLKGKIVRILRNKIKYMIEDKNLWLSLEALKKILKADIFWDRIKKIEIVSNTFGYVYDLHIPETNTFVAGFGGLIVHNTASTKFVFREFEEYSGTKTFYINCWDYRSVYSILSKIALGLGRFVQRRGISKDEVIEKIIEICNKTKVGLVVCLDEVDQLIFNQEEALYDLLRINQYIDNPFGLVLISNNPYIFTEVEPRIKSSLDIEGIEFKAYSLEEMKDILKERARLAFRSIEEGVLLLAANKAVQYGGDVRVGLECLIKAGRFAESQNSSKLKIEHIKKILPGVKPVKPEIIKERVSEDERIILNILEEKKKLFSGELYKEYCKRIEVPVSERAFRNFVNHLAEVGLINIRVRKRKVRGRTRMISKA